MSGKVDMMEMIKTSVRVLRVYSRTTVCFMLLPVRRTTEGLEVAIRGGDMVFLHSACYV